MQKFCLIKFFLTLADLKTINYDENVIMTVVSKTAKNPKQDLFYRGGRLAREKGRQRRTMKSHNKVISLEIFAETVARKNFICWESMQ